MYVTLLSMSYPNDIQEASPACLASVEPHSPAARAGLEPGMIVFTVNGEPLRDVLDWYWLSDEGEVELEIAAAQEIISKQTANHTSVFDPSAKQQAVRKVIVKRTHNEPWGLSFSEVLYDGLRRCANNCVFCFMKMLPPGMREALYVRDDDYRLSFLQGNFVTLTNLSNADVARIIKMRLSPLNVSLHAINPKVRKQMMGSNHARGLKVLRQLLAAGIECRAQIVLMPGINDGTVLDETLAFIRGQAGIVATGVVPYGYTRFAAIQRGYESPKSAQEVIKQLEHRAPQVQLADEFFVKAWPGKILKHLPPASYYGSYPLLEDGIGMIRHCVDSYEKNAVRFFPLRGATNTRERDKAEGQGSRQADGGMLGGGFELSKGSILATGEAFASVLHELLPQYRARILAIKNNYFGGNVDVAGLLTAEDVIKQLALAEISANTSSSSDEVPCQKVHSKTAVGEELVSKGILRLILPPILFNDEGVTLDNKTAADIAQALGIPLKVLDFS